ncbi:MAG: SPFH domain-containing protein [Ardenticatenaceae bacterium]|nr:SPFH domain-containing protein [Ardenticatenaceae bacterium]
MNKKIAWVVTVVVLVTFVLMFVFWALKWVVPALLVSLILSVALVTFLFSRTYVYIGELEYGVVFDHRGDFSRFLDSGWRVLNPFTEKLTDRMTKGSQKAQATSYLRTRDGIPVEISWNVSFKVVIENIRPAIAFKMARTLPKSADKLVTGKAVQSLRHIIEQKSVWELYKGDAAKELELQLCAQLNARLQLRHKEAFSAHGVAPVPSRPPNEPISGLGPDEIPWYDVQITAIKMPERIEKALEVAHERRLQTETAVHALERLREVVSQFQDKDMERLAELEKLRILDKDNGSMLHVVASLAQTIRQN